MRLLSYCIDLLFPPRATELLVRDATEEQLAPVFLPTCHYIGDYPCTTLLAYDQPLVRALLIEAKFKGNTRAHALLGSMLRVFLSNHPPVILVPIPLSRQRRRTRGINQVEEIIRHAAPTHLIRPLLTRIRDTLPQTDLSAKARLHNVADAFFAPTIDPALTYLLIDDVTTTGATLADAARALKAAGAVHIQLLALARA